MSGSVFERSFFAVLRNRSFVMQMALMFACGACCVCGAFCFASVEAALWCTATAGACSVVFACVSVRRYREIAELAEEVDEVLRCGRAFEFADYREGDVAVLGNSLSKMVAKLARLAEQLDSEKHALSDALADISHQIRTPLTSIGLMVAMAESAEDDEGRRKAARQAAVMVERVSWLVTSLLKIAKLDAGALRLRSDRVAVRDVVERACEPLAAAFEIRGVDLNVEGVRQAFFMGDGPWSAEAIQNIVKNSLEHTPRGGCVSIEASESALGTRIAVSDTGDGISPDDLPFIFDRFYRGSCEGCSDDGRFQGFGIGLALARGIVVAQGGSLRAFNLREGGACFEMVIPKLVI